MDRKFCPGGGTLCVHVADEYDFDSKLLEESIIKNVPVCHSYGRMPNQLSGASRSLVYSAISKALNELYLQWHVQTGVKEKAPIVNRTYMEKWFDRAGVTRCDILSHLGVAQAGDTIDLGVTPRGGRKLVITTSESDNGRIFERIYKGRPATMDSLDCLTDITILTELSRMNRLVLYWQICESCGWRKVHTDFSFLETLTGGIDLSSWRILNNEVSTKPGEPYLLPYHKDSWLICEGGGNVVPWRVCWDKKETGVVSKNFIDTLVSITCMPIEYCWCAEYNKVKNKE